VSATTRDAPDRDHRKDFDGDRVLPFSAGSTAIATVRRRQGERAERRKRQTPANGERRRRDGQRSVVHRPAAAPTFWWG
jgi:hypothetical protein